MQVAVSVVVSTYNKPWMLNRVLEGLADQTFKPTQIIIADDGSTADTASLISQWSKKLPSLEHCWQPDFGFRKAKILNSAILQTTCDTVIFLDGDCVPFPNFVADHVQHTELGVVLAGGRILTSERYEKRLRKSAEQRLPSNILYWIKRFVARDIDRLLPFLRLPGGFWRFYAAKNWRLVRGCNFSVSRDVLISVNGFDESFTGWGFEDSDIGIRLINLGLRIKSLRFAAPVLHLWHPEEPRDKAGSNRKELSDTIRSGRIEAPKGLREHEH